MQFETGWDGYIQTPPNLTKLFDGSNYQYAESPLDGAPPPLSPFIPSSPSLPDLLAPSADPTSTLCYLGLSKDYPETNSPSKLAVSEEFENRSIYIYNIEPATNIAEIKAFLRYYGELTSIEFVEDDVVQVSFYDLRHAMSARRSIPTAIFKGFILDARYAPPAQIMDPQKPPNNGTIVIFHLPNGFTNTQLSDTFTRFGEIRQIRGTPSKPNQRFVEYWDIRASRRALETMNGKMILGSRISIEFSLPGGFRREFQKKIYAINLK